MIPDKALVAVILLATLLAGGLAVKSTYDANAALRARLESQTDRTVAATLEAQGQRTLADRADRSAAQTIILREKTHDAVADLRSQAAAGAALDPALAERLRAHDEFLCQSRPALCPAAADAQR